jgi:hypothetical protein
MTLEQFAERLRALLQEALEAGHSVDDIGEMAESVLQDKWEND